MPVRNEWSWPQFTTSHNSSVVTGKISIDWWNKMIAKRLFCSISLYVAWERIYYVILISDHFLMCFLLILSQPQRNRDARVLPLLFSSPYMMDHAANMEMEGSSDSSSIGVAISGRGHHLPDDEDIFYIPERRPSLDLGSNLMDWISQGWYF